LKAYTSPFMDDAQFAYKENRSTLDAVATLTHHIAFELDKGSKNIRCAFLDFSSAFNTIPRSQVLDLLSKYGTPGWLVKWFGDYFTDCIQFVSLGGKSSECIPNDAGVSQGAVLSPFLFSAHLDGFRAELPNKLFKYADDLVLCSPCCTAMSNLVLYASLKAIRQWSEEHGLILNRTKCVQCEFSFSRSTNIGQSPLTVNGELLPSVEHVQYLGVTISKNLSWSLYVKHFFQNAQVHLSSSSGCDRTTFHIFLLNVVWMRVCCQCFFTVRQLSSLDY